MRTLSELGATVVGGGPAGLTAALSLARAGVATRLLAPPHRVGGGPDRRTAALFTGSIELLRNLGVWDALRADCAPILGIRIVDDTGALLRAPDILFTASEVGLEAFGWNVPNSSLISTLLAAAQRPDRGVEVVETQGVSVVEAGSETVRLTTVEGLTVEAALVAAADGRKSICREAAGIATRGWSYPQSAVATQFSHTRPHRDISTEFHRKAGPFTTVPLPGCASSLVWVERPEEAERLAGLDDAAFRAVLEERLMGLLGAVLEIGPRAVFPLKGLTADVYGRKRIALIGEAGHVIPPIGAQGLNLGFRDAASLASAVSLAVADGADIGHDEVLTRYSRGRERDITQRVYTVDLLNRSLISTVLPVHLARGLGIHALKRIGPLRRHVIREGLQPSGDVPTLMQPGGAELMAQRVSRRLPIAAA